MCAQFIHCRYDGGAAFALQFTTSDVSSRDYFRSSVSGQAKTASVTWAVGFDFSDAVAAPATLPSGSSITFRALDVNGDIEAMQTLSL